MSKEEERKKKKKKREAQIEKELFRFMESVLDKTIKSVLENKADKIEFLVLLDKPWKNERENLRELAERRNQEDGTIQVFVQQTDHKITWLRNKAFEIASNENVFIINDDIEVSKNFDKIKENNRSHYG